MPTEQGYLAANTWASATSSDTISASTTFVNPTFFPGADSVEVAFTEFTKAAGDAATVILYHRSYDEDGTQRTVILDEELANLSASATTERKGRVLLTNVPAGEFYIGLNVTSASTGFTGTALIRYVDSSTIRSGA